jgi:hypothetical protein
LFIGAPNGTADATVDMSVHKFGRSTGYRVGRVDSVTFTGTVDFETGSLLFENQILIRNAQGQMFSDDGDSGALILERTSQNAVGLLFAGSASHTLANHIDDVLNELNVQLA